MGGHSKNGFVKPLIWMTSGLRCATHDFPLLGRSDISYERQALPGGQMRPVPRAEDPVLVQVRHPDGVGATGAIFFLNTASHTLQRSYLLAELGIKDPVHLYEWENRPASEQAATKIPITLPAHFSALYFFSLQPTRGLPLHLPF
jgi:hypothetical protein